VSHESGLLGKSHTAGVGRSNVTRLAGERRIVGWVGLVDPDLSCRLVSNGLPSRESFWVRFESGVVDGLALGYALLDASVVDVGWREHNTTIGRNPWPEPDRTPTTGTLGRNPTGPTGTLGRNPTGRNPTAGEFRPDPDRG
jgi:hypothetical protein